MASGSPEPGRERTPDLSKFTPGPGGGLIDREKLDETRRRADRTTGIALLVLGIGLTIMNMTMVTENALATQFANVGLAYGVDEYHRPPGLGALAMVGVIGHPLIYALTLYATLLRWRAGKRALWVIVLGAIAASLFSFAIVAIGLTMHPELMAAAQAGTLPTVPATP